MLDKLREAMKKAWSIENKEKHDCIGNLSFIGTLQEGSLVFQFYEDDAGHYFYSSDAGKDLDAANKRKGKRPA